MFSDRSIDFFSALRSRLYDEQVRQFINQVGLDRLSMRLLNSTEAPPEFRRPNFDLQTLKHFGQLMLEEAQRLQKMRLVDEYMLQHNHSRDRRS
jgi:hypothetical protein